MALRNLTRIARSKDCPRQLDKILLTTTPPSDRLHPIAKGLNFPTSVTVDDKGVIYVSESGLPFDSAPPGGTLLRIGPAGTRTTLLSGLRSPVNGLTWRDDWIYISEGGNPGRISRYSTISGAHENLVDGLPGFGNYQTNMVAFGPDGRCYFGQGSMTNSGIIGSDSADMAWLRKIQHHCDIPGYGITLTGRNVEVRHPPATGVSPEESIRVVTGAFVPYGTPTTPQMRIAPRLPCTAAIMSCRPDGTDLQLVAWGLRNPYGLGFLPDGRLLATDQGADDRGSRPVPNCPDFLYEVRHGAWYGWPDFFGGVPVTSPRFHTDGQQPNEFLLSNHAELPPPEKPLVEFEVNACATKFAVIPNTISAWGGQLIVALFGDEKPLTAPLGPRVGRKLVRVNPVDGSIHDVRHVPFQRPIDVTFLPTGEALVVDFGEFEFTPTRGIAAKAGTGSIWKLPQTFINL